MAWTTYAALAAGMALFGSATPVARLVTQEVPPLVAAAVRVVLAALVLGPIAWHRGLRWDRLDGGQKARAIVLAAIGMFGFTVLLAYGMQRATGVTGSIVMGTTPAVTAIAAVAFMGESPTWRRWGAIGLAMAGVMALRFGGGEGFDLLGAALVFGAVLSEATYTLVGKRVMDAVDPVGAAALATVLAVPAFLVAAAWEAPGVDWAGLGWKTWAGMAWWGIGTLALGSWVWYVGVRDAPGHVAAAFMGVMPVSALLLSYGLLGEDPRWWHVPGFLLVLGAVALVSWDHARATTQARSR